MKGTMLKSLRGLFAVLSVVVSSGFAAPAGAQDTIKVAVGQIDAWANQVPTLGMKVGIFQKHDIVLENFGTQGAGETLQAVISGSADIGIGVGTPGAMRAFGGASARLGRGLYRCGRYLLVCASHFADPKRERHKRQAYDCLFDQWFDLRQRLARADRPLRSEGEAGPDRRTARDVHNDNVGADRHRLVGGTVRAEGFAGQDHPCIDA